MILTSLTLENFKGISKPVRIDLKPITLLFGPNSAGKSTIIQALHYAREILQNDNLDPKNTLMGNEGMKLGGFKDLVHKHDLGRDIEMTFVLDVRDVEWPDYLTDKERFEINDWGVKFISESFPFIKQIAFRITISWSKELGCPIVRKLVVSVNGSKPIAIIRSSSCGQRTQLVYFDVQHPIFWGLSVPSVHKPYVLKGKYCSIQEEEIERDLSVGDGEGCVTAKDLELSALCNTEHAVDHYWSNKHDEELWESSNSIGNRLEELGRDNIHLGFLDLVNDDEDYARIKSLQSIELRQQLHALPSRKKPLSLGDIWAVIEQYEWYLPGLGDDISKLSTMVRKKGLKGGPISNIDGPAVKGVPEDAKVAKGTPVEMHAIRSALSTIIVGPLDLLCDELDRTLYIGPLRKIPSRDHKPPDFPDEGRWSNGLAAWDLIHGADEHVLKQINDWLGGVGKLNCSYQIKVHRTRQLPFEHSLTQALENGGILKAKELAAWLYELPIETRIALEEIASGIKVSLQDVGTGISQVLPIIVAAIVHRDGILAVEQPELHIHPALQVMLGDLFAERLEDSQAHYLLETHSEHLLLRLLRRIRETAENELPEGAPALKPDQVAVNYIHQGAEAVEAKRLRISLDGDFLDRWPQGFFEERAEELF